MNTDKARVQVEVTVQNESQADRNAAVVVGGAQLMVVVKAGESKTVSTTLFVNNPRLWSPESPTLYETKVELKESGTTIDHQTAKYGIRSLSFDVPPSPELVAAILTLIQLYVLAYTILYRMGRPT